MDPTCAAETVGHSPPAGRCGGTRPSEGNETARRVFAGLPSRYDRLAEWLSFGQNARWRAALVAEVAACRPRVVLDVATGTAGVALSLRARTGAAVVGVDLDEGMVRQGAATVRHAGVDGIALGLARAEELPLPDASVDALSFTYLLRYVDDPASVLVELARVVRPGGVVASLDFSVPARRLWRVAWVLYTRTVLPAAGFATGGVPWFRVGRFLGPNIERHEARFPQSGAVAAWEAAGIHDVRVRRMSLGGGVVTWGRRV